MSKRYVIMHAEDAHGHPYRLAPGIPAMVLPDAVFALGAVSPGIYWKKGGVFITKQAAIDFAEDNLIQNTYRIVEIERSNHAENILS